MKCSECNGDSALLVKVRKDGWEGEICLSCLLATKEQVPVKVTEREGVELIAEQCGNDFNLFDLDPDLVVPFTGYGDISTGAGNVYITDNGKGPASFDADIMWGSPIDAIEVLVEKAKEKWGEDKGLQGERLANRFEHSFEQDLRREQESREQPMLDEEGRKKYAQAEARLHELIAEAREGLKKVDFERIKDFAWDNPDTTGLRLEANSYERGSE